MQNLFLVYLSICICFGRLCAHHQEKQCIYATLVTSYFVWLTVWYASCSCFSWWSAHSCQKHVEINKYKYNKNKLCTKLVLFTRLNIDARSTEHKKFRTSIMVRTRSTTGCKITRACIILAKITQNNNTEVNREWNLESQSRPYILLF